MVGDSPMNTKPIEYRDSEGIMRRVIVPSDDGANPEEGIPVSLQVDLLYEHMPLPFRQRLTDALWAQGLIEPADYLRAGAAEKIRAAWLSVVRYDVLDIQNLARETMK
jgi:hypothetical protein